MLRVLFGMTIASNLEVMASNPKSNVPSSLLLLFATEDSWPELQSTAL